MIDAGLRDAGDFIEANYKSDEEYKSQEEIIEEKTYKTTTKSKIAFHSDRDGNFEIYIMNVDGSGQIRLTDNPADDWGHCFLP